MSGALGWILVLGAWAPEPKDAPRKVEARVSYRSSTGVYLDQGRDAQLLEGDLGLLSREGRDLAKVEIRHLTQVSAFAEVIEILDAEPARAGDLVVFEIPAARFDRKPSEPASTGPGANGKQPFVPLLAPLKGPATSERRNLFDGNLRLSTSLLRDQERGLDYAYHRVSTSGAGNRLFGEPWSIEWAFDLNTRTGDGYDDHPDRDRLQLRVDQLVARRHLRDGSALGFGRILPLALPDIGRIDGAYGEKVLDQRFRVGAIAGFRPDRKDLGFSAKEFVASTYGVFNQQFDDATRLWAAAGVLASVFDGAVDQQAILASARISKRSAWISMSSQVDLYGGEEEVRSGAGLTRLHVSAGSGVCSWLSARTGMHQYQLPEIDSYRELYDSDEYFDRGHRRSYVALRELLPWQLSFEEEIAYLSGADFASDYQWTVRLRKSGLPWGADLDVALYRLVGFEGDGFGGSLALMVQPGDRWSLQLMYDTSEIDYGDVSDNLDSETLALMLNGWIDARTSWYARTSLAQGNDVDALTVDFALTFRF